MARLLVHVEGQTEETFVNEVLRDHLFRAGGHSVSARIFGNPRSRDRRGGIRGWDSARKDIVRHLVNDPDAFGTTLVDYYALPQRGQKAWPGRAEASRRPFPSKAVTVEQALLANILEELGFDFDLRRFIPHVVMHEFEGLLFSDCAAFSRAVGRPNLAPAFQNIRDAFVTPEEINDSPETAPSKRVQALLPEYEKPLYGNLAILEIGLERLRSECPHFAGWLAILERLPGP